MDLWRAQRSNPIEPVGGLELVANPRTGQHAAVAHQYDALERETLLLSGFVASAQTVLDERDKSEGSSLQQVMKVADDLLGSGGDASSSAPKAGDFNAVNGKLKGIGGTLNSTNPAMRATA